ADGDYDFWLPMPRVIAVDREADCSIFALFHELQVNSVDFAGSLLIAGPMNASLKSCHSLIRNALVGGGVGEQEARELVETYCYPARPAEHDLKLARDVLKAAIHGVDASAVGVKKKAEAAEADAS
ncbi:MAG: hypothetical protein V4696_06240, partial [Pseudomonadota bacterium]